MDRLQEVQTIYSEKEFLNLFKLSSHGKEDFSQNLKVNGYLMPEEAN
jgi:hypothetical protein